jgi:hypothetical protein
MKNDLNLSDHNARWEPFVILSVTPGELSTQAEDVRNADFVEWLLANDIPYKALNGSYKGKEEVSFLIRETDYSLVESDPAAWLEDQETVLVLSAQAPHRHGLRTATLIYLNDRPNEVLGSWLNVTKDEALSRDAWTLDPSTGEYWVTKKGQFVYAEPDIQSGGMWHDTV